MIRHIAFLKFKPDVTKEDIRILESKLQKLPGKIPEIRNFEYGADVVRSERSYDFALIASFKNVETLIRYQVHPEHVVSLKSMQTICESIIVVDFEI